MILGEAINLAIFSTELGNREGLESEKVVYFYPQSLDIKEQIKIIGLADAFVKFICSFGREQDCKFITTPNICQILYKAEEEYWIFLKIVFEFGKISKIRDNLRAVLKKSCCTFKLLHGNFSIKDDDKHPIFNKHIYPFFNQFVQSFTTFNFKPRALLVEGLKYRDYESLLPCREPLERLSFLELQTDLATLEAIYSGQGLIHSLLTCRDKSIIWSSIDESTQTAISDVTTLVDCLIKASNTIVPTISPPKTPHSKGVHNPEYFGRFLPLRLTFDLINQNKSADGRTLEIHLSTLRHPTVLLAYQIFSHCLGLIFDKHRLDRVLALEGEDFFASLGVRLEERLGKEYLQQKRNSLYHPAPSPGLDGGSKGSMHCLIVNESHDTYRLSSSSSTPTDKNNHFDHQLILSRLDRDIQRLPPGSDITIKFNRGKTKTEPHYWFLARSAWPIRSSIVISKRCNEVGQNVASADVIRREAFQHLAQL